MTGAVIDMSVLDKFLNIMRLNPDDDDDFYNEDYDYDDDYEDDAPKKSSRKEKRREKEKEEESYAAPEKAPKASSKVTPIRSVRTTSPTTSGMEVCVIKPTSVEDAREITETLLASRTVVLNVEGLDVQTAQRIIDFTSGSCFAINGKLRKISNYIFVITPPSVDISGDFLNLVDSYQSHGLSDF